MLFSYRLSIYLYAFLVRIASWYQPKAKLFIEGRKGLLLKIKVQMADENRPRIWMHCSSLGEFEQGRPLLESLRKQYPNFAIILTFFSPSGYQVRKKYEGADYIFYLPVDTASNAKQFVRDTNPALAIFVKYDLWYYYLFELQQRNIPTILIDAIFRPQQGFFRWYGAVQRRMLHLITHIFVQNEASKNLLQAIGIQSVSISGDTRFDRVLDVANESKKIIEIEKLSQQNKLFIAGSTWAEDEQLLVQLLPQIPNEWKLIIVPHEVDEQRISSIIKLFSGKIKRWSEWESNEIFSEQVLVIDSIGLLLKTYRYASLVWVGGGLAKGGVHNVLEAAVYGVPIAFGPVYHKYQEAVDLVENQAATCCKNAAELNAFFEKMSNTETHNIASEAAKNYVASKAGATKEISNYLAAKNWLKIL